jgi:NADH:ubiquinone oxidoreductase subunit K
MLEYIFIVCVALVAIALAGIAVSRHLVFTMLAIELIFVASATLLVAFFSFAVSSSPGAVTLLIGIWAAGGAQAIGMVTLYACMKSQGLGFSAAGMSRFKW